MNGSMIRFLSGSSLSAADAWQGLGIWAMQVLAVGTFLVASPFLIQAMLSALQS